MKCKASRLKLFLILVQGLIITKKGLKELIHLICTQQCSQVVVNYQDRLVRFGFELIEDICQENDVEITVINQTKAESSNEELVDDVLSEYQNVFNFKKIKEEQITCKFSLVITCDISKDTLTNFISKKEHRKVEVTEIVNEVQTNIANVCNYGLSFLSSGCNWAKDKLKNLNAPCFTLGQITKIAIGVLALAMTIYVITQFGAVGAAGAIAVDMVVPK